MAMKLANSVSVPLPRMIAPAARSLRATVESLAGFDPPSATEPAVVGMSKVAMLSLMMTGMPKSGPTLGLSLPASSRACGLTRMYELSGWSPWPPLIGCGLLVRSNWPIRMRYARTTSCGVAVPA